MSQGHTAVTRPALGLADAVSLVIGIIIGAGIFRLPKEVFANVADINTGVVTIPAAAVGMGLWVLGGLIAVVGALCYAELATTYPHAAGEYLYLRRAYGPFVGFFFAWANLTVIRSGASIAPISYIFAEYAQPFVQSHIYDFKEWTKLILVAAAVVGLTIVNALGIHPGRRTQNTLTLAKVLGLAGVIVAGLYLYLRPATVLVIEPRAEVKPSYTLAMIAVLWAYSGWHEVAYVVTDLRDHRKNFARAILLGVGAVAIIYLAVNAALLVGLGLNAVRSEERIGAVLAERAVGDWGKHALTVLVIVSALGAVNGQILTGGRFFAGFGELHPGFGWLGSGRTRRGAPLVALIAQAAISLWMVALVETSRYWKPWVADLAQRFWTALPPDFSKPTDGFGTLMVCTAPVFWFFFLLTGAALFILRVKEPDRPRPFKVPLFPVVGLAFCAACVFMLAQSTIAAIAERPAEAIVVGVVFLLGLPVYALGRRGYVRRGHEDEEAIA